MAGSNAGSSTCPPPWGRICALDHPVLVQGGKRMVPLGETLRILGIPSAETDGILCAARQPCCLTRGFAHLIRRMFAQNGFGPQPPSRKE